MSESTEIDIRPEVNILSVLRHLNYSPWFALAEFVDNALGSFLARASLELLDPSSPSLAVFIEIDTSGPGRIVIRDNAYGISKEDFPRAFRAADTPPDTSGLSEFGMGMKSAASWFASDWKVRTSVVGDPIQRSIDFNLKQIVETRTNQLTVFEEFADPSSHFTSVELTGLNHTPQGRTLGKIRSHLASIYRQYLRLGILDLFVNGDPVQFPEVEILTAPPDWQPDSPSIIWKKDFSLDLGGGRVAKGFAGLRAVGSTSEAGFALFRRDRLILGSHDETYRPVEIFKRSNSYPYQRLFGEIELSGFDVSHTKDGFRWDDHEEGLLDALRGALTSSPMDLLRQADDYRVKTPSLDVSVPIQKGAIRVADVFQHRLDEVIKRANAEPAEEEEIATLKVSPLTPIEGKHIQIFVEGGLWRVDLRGTLDDSEPDWLRLGTDIVTRSDVTGEKVTNLQVTVNFAHPFTRRYIGANVENSDIFWATAGGLAVALALAQRAGARSQFVLSYLNVVLRASFEQKELAI